MEMIIFEIDKQYNILIHPKYSFFIFMITQLIYILSLDKNTITKNILHTIFIVGYDDISTACVVQ